MKTLLACLNLKSEHLVKKSERLVKKIIIGKFKLFTLEKEREEHILGILKTLRSARSFP